MNVINMCNTYEFIDTDYRCWYIYFSIQTFLETSEEENISELGIFKLLEFGRRYWEIKEGQSRKNEEHCQGAEQEKYKTCSLRVPE